VPAPTADAKPVLFGAIMLVLGIPVYVWQRRRAGQTTSKAQGYVVDAEHARS
jgi:hypothetical protein